MRLLFARTCSWQSFILEGLPGRMKTVEKKRHSLASAVAAWNIATAEHSSRLNLTSVSDRLKLLLVTKKTEK